ncbi:TPA: hypothetical protein N0F65_000557, partial [Lagenidium giganteum]
YKILESKTYNVEEGSKKFLSVSKYPFNPQAKKLQYVRTAFSWIVETGEDGVIVGTSRLQHYTKVQEYKHLLELDASDNIIGGKWLKESNKKHPDFLWFPTGVPAENTITNVGLSYKNVKELLNESIKGRC